MTGDHSEPRRAGTQSYLRIVGRQLWRYRLNRVAVYVIGALIGLAASADFVASDKPLVAHFHGTTYLLPNLRDPPGLRMYDNQLLMRAMKEGDWAIITVVPWGCNSHDLSSVLAPPSSRHWLGTDSSGRDVLARVLHGARVSLAVGAMAVTVLVAVGTLLGTLAGYYGGLVDVVLMRVVEVVHSIPTILLLVTMLAVLAPEGWGAVVAMMLVIGLVRWTDVARLVRGEILRVRTLDYVQASRALGASDARIILRHVLPNSLSPVLVSASFSMAAAILMESALSFLGFGIPDDMASWGGLLSDGRANSEAWWLAIFPGAAIFVTVTVYNIAGEGLRDALDPRMKA
jgi:peptide/nickel transport system permease protein